MNRRHVEVVSLSVHLAVFSSLDQGSLHRRKTHLQASRHDLIGGEQVALEALVGLVDLWVVNLVHVSLHRRLVLSPASLRV